MKESWCWTSLAITDSRIMAGLIWLFTIMYLWIPVDTYLWKFVNASWVHLKKYINILVLENFTCLDVTQMFFRWSLAPQNSVFWGAQNQAQKSDKYWEPKAVTHSPPTASWLKGCQQAFFRLTTWWCSVTVVSKGWNAENSVFTVTAGIILCYTSSCSGFSILDRGQYENACPCMSSSWTQWWSNSLDTFGHIKNM